MRNLRDGSDATGYPYEGRRYCCHGCVPSRERSERHAGALRPPAWGRSVEVHRAVFIAEDPEEVGRFLADIDLLHPYEQKLAQIQITGIGQNEKTACATADGHFGPVLYHIELHFDAADGGGYESTLCSGGPILGLRGSFKVHPAEGGCVVTHVERYQFAPGPIAWRLGQLWRGGRVGAALRKSKSSAALAAAPRKNVVTGMGSMASRDSQGTRPSGSSYGRRTRLSLTRPKDLLRVGSFGFAVNFIWELAHTPLYRVTAGWSEHLICCTIASLADGLGLVLIFIVGAIVFDDGRWTRCPTISRIGLAVVLGFGGAVLVELVALARGWWSYLEEMPRLPGTPIGLSPLLQFTVLPVGVLFYLMPRRWNAELRAR